MARTGYPHLYNGVAPSFGLPPDESELLFAFYDYGADAINAVHSLTTVRSKIHLNWKVETLSTDYRSDLPGYKLIPGRSLTPVSLQGENGRGADVIRQIKKALDNRGVAALMRHRAMHLILNDRGEVAGIAATGPSNRPLRIRARKAVIFCTGGFSHNREYTRNFLRGPVYATAAVPTNEGDFITIAASAGAALGNMNNAWWSEISLEAALESDDISIDVWSDMSLVQGQSAIVVNRLARGLLTKS